MRKLKALFNTVYDKDDTVLRCILKGNIVWVASVVSKVAYPNHSLPGKFQQHFHNHSCVDE